MSRTSLSKLVGGAVVWAVLVTPAVVAPTSHGWAQQDLIIVTARRREETLQDVPISVSVKSQAQIDDLGITDLEVLSEFTPGFQVRDNLGSGGGRDQANLRFRGITEQISTAGARTGAVFWDGAYVSAGFGILPLIDLERAEIIKGPQNAYFARNTFAGAANFVPRSPGDEFEANANVTFGFGLDDDEQNSYKGVVAAGGPVTDDIGLRLAGQWLRDGADYEYGNGDPNGTYENKALLGVATWDVSDDFSLKFSGFFVDGDDTTQQQSTIAEVAPGDCNKIYTGSALNPLTGVVTPFSTDLSLSKISLFCGDFPKVTDSNLRLGPTGQLDPALSLLGGATIGLATTVPEQIAHHNFQIPDRFGNEYRLWRAQVSGVWDLPNGFTASILGSYGANKASTITDFRFGSGPAGMSSDVFPTGRYQFTRDAFLETRLRSPGENRLRGELGVSYYDQVQDNTTTSLFRPANLDQQENRAYGIFGSVEFDILENLTASFEARWTDDKQTLVFVGDPSFPGFQENLVNEYNDFMPRAILSWELNESTNIYFNWSQGSINAVSTRCPQFVTQLAAEGIPIDIDCDAAGVFTDIQQLTSYEIGIKQSLDWLQYTLAGYYQEWDNQPFNNVVLVASGGTPVLTVPGDSEYWGVDFEFVANPVEGVEFSGSVGWIDATLTELGATGSAGTTVLCPSAQAGRSPFDAFTTGDRCTALDGGGVINSEGLRPRYVAQWTATVGLMLTRQLFDTGRDAYLRVDAIYEGGRFVDNFEYNHSAGYWKANLRVGTQVNDNLRAEAFITNLTDEKTIPQGSTTGLGAIARKSFSVLPAKREVGIRLFADF